MTDVAPAEESLDVAAPPPAGPGPWEARLGAAALVFVSLAVFCTALGHDFLVNWDDPRYVVQNPLIRGLTLEHVLRAFRTFHLGNYAPLHLISYMVDYELWGLKAWGYIATNIVLHTASAVLFYLLLRRLYPGRAWTLFAAFLFLLHPVQVESVVWVSQRKNVLAMFFFLLSFWFYVSCGEGSKRRRGAYWLSVFCSFLGLLSKSVVVILPVALVLYDLCFSQRKGWKALLLDKVPFVLAALAFALLALESQTMKLGGGRTGYHGGSLYATFLTMLPVLGSYLRLVFWPTGLSAYYSPPVRTVPDLQVGLAALLCCALALLGVWLYRRRRDLFFWYALFFLGLAPVSQVVPLVTLMNDRYLYFPMLGASVFVSAVVLGAIEWGTREGTRSTAPLTALGAVAVVACAGATLLRIPVWRDSAALWSDAAAKAPQVPLVQDALGEGLLEKGRVDGAIERFSLALRIWSLTPPGRLDEGARLAIASTRNNLGTAYGMKGLSDRAVEQFAQALALDPSYSKAWFNMGNAFMHLNLPEQAVRSFEAAVRFEPGNPQFTANLVATRGLLKARSVAQPGAGAGGAR